MNKSLEMLYVKWFTEKVGWNDSKIQKYEKPDFIVSHKGLKIGLEVTGIFKNEGRKGSPNKQKESLNNKWLSQLSEQYYSISETPIKVQVLFSQRSENTNLPDVKKLSQFIKKNTPKTDLENTTKEIKNEETPKYTINIKRLPESFGQYRRWQFVNNHIGLSRELSANLIKQKVSNKIKKSKKYDKDLDALILLIVIDSSSESGMFHIGNHDLKVNNAAFESVYIGFHPKEVIKIG